MNLPGYDTWLEAPYVARDREQAAFESFCERWNIELDDPDAGWVYERYVDDDGPDPDRFRDDPEFYDR